MNALLDFIFGFTSGTFGAPDTSIGLVNPISGWIYALGILAIGALILISYRGLTGPRWARLTLGSLRWITIALLFTLLLGPQIEQSRSLIEPDRVLVMLDRSGSMNMPELQADGRLLTRGELLDQSITQSAAVFDQLANRSELDLYSFDDRSTPLDTIDAYNQDEIPEFASTALGKSLQAAVNNAGTSPISGIVIFSDGRSTDQPSNELIESMLSAGVSVISVPIGSPDPIRDASIRLVDAPAAAFAKDRVPISINASTAGYKPGDELFVELIDQATGTVLDSSVHVIAESDSSQAINADEMDINLSHTFSESGSTRLQVRISSQNQVGNQSADLIAENNTQDLEIRIIDEPMRVLYIDGHPRWEYRYLKNHLMREQSIDATTMMLASDRRYIEEGQPLAGPIPDSLDEWEPFDVVILGDIRPDLFSEAQLTTLKEHIETRGCGLLWIAGEGATPSAWNESVLSSLLPSQSGKGDSLSQQSSDQPAVLRLTEESERAGLLTASDGSIETSVSDPSTGWSILRWTHSFAPENLKPGVTSLAMSEPLDGSAPESLVTTMRYGAGQVGYVGTDEIWRWRYGRGEDLPERFWIPMIRTLARGTIDRRAAPAAIMVSPTPLLASQDARLSLELFDSSVIDSLPSSIDARIESLSINTAETIVALNGSGSDRSGLWSPNEPGMYSISVSNPLIGAEPITKAVRVLASWAEATNPNTDHESLIELSSQTNGHTIGLNELDRLPTLLKNRTRITSLPPETTALWDRPIVLIMLVLLLSIEWIGRRTLRLA